MGMKNQEKVCHVSVFAMTGQVARAQFKPLLQILYLHTQVVVRATGVKVHSKVFPGSR